jgi:DNA-binding MarR family transcriptional regulator
MLQSELAAELAIARSTTTRALDTLEQKGLLERRRTDGDGREISVYPTPAGIEIKVALNASAGGAAEKIRKILGKQEFTDAVLKIRDVRAALE